MPSTFFIPGSFRPIIGWIEGCDIRQFKVGIIVKTVNLFTIWVNVVQFSVRGKVAIGYIDTDDGLVRLRLGDNQYNLSVGSPLGKRNRVTSACRSSTRGTIVLSFHRGVSIHNPFWKYRNKTAFHSGCIE